MLADGRDMIRVVAIYNLATDDFETLDRFTDDLMDILTLNGSILEPDLALSLTERTLELQLIVDTADPLEAVERGHRALREAFVAAGQDLPNTRVMLHRDLLDSATQMRSELVGT